MFNIGGGELLVILLVALLVLLRILFGILLLLVLLALLANHRQLAQAHLDQLDVGARVLVAPVGAQPLDEGGTRRLVGRARLGQRVLLFGGRTRRRPPTPS